MKRLSILALAAPLALVGATLTGPVMALAQTPTATVPGESIGPAIGHVIPMGTHLLDSHGRPTTLATIGRGKPIMLVLFRSAAWCPFCQAQLKGLGPVAAAATAKGVRFVALSYDTPETLAAFSAKQHLTFPLLSDGHSRLIDALGLRDPQYKAGSIAFGVPYPTTLLVDGAGRVKAKSVETDYRVRPSQADLITMLNRL